MPIKIFSDN